MELISCKEAKLAGLRHYYTGKPCKRGHVAKRFVNGGCVICANEDQRKYYADNPEKHISKARDWYFKNKDISNLGKRKWYAKNSEKLRAISAEHRARRMYRVPSWCEKEQILEFYNNCPEGYEVDHIYPLQGERVSGLHVISNLQYLTVAENRAKRNRVNI